MIEDVLKIDVRFARKNRLLAAPGIGGPLKNLATPGARPAWNVAIGYRALARARRAFSRLASTATISPTYSARSAIQSNITNTAHAARAPCWCDSAQQ